VSRRRLHSGASLSTSVRAEASVTAVVLVVTAVLTLTTPPPRTKPAGSRATGTASSAVVPTASVRMPLRDDSSALVTITRPTVAATSGIRVGVVDARGTLVPVADVQLKASLPSEKVDGIVVPLTRQGQVWKGRYRFPLPGDWKLTLTVADRSQTSVVTSSDVTVSR
jgi:hypothetical protein